MLALNLTARFLLELGALGAVSAWGFGAAHTAEGRAALGLGIPLVLAAVWGAFIGPGASTPGAVKAALQVLVFGLAAAALAVGIHRPGLATAFVAAVAVNATLMHVWEQ